MFIIAESVDVKDAEQTKRALLAAIDEHDAGGFPIDLGGSEPSQIALQLCIAGVKELETRGFAPMPGAFLKAILANDASTDKAG